MSRSHSRRRVAIGSIVVLAAALIAALMVALARSPAHAAPHADRAAGRVQGTTLIDVGAGAGAASRPIPPGFLGLSLEFPAVTAYAGHDPSALDPVLVQLIRNLTPGQTPVLRIGGDSTDWTWWPVRGMARPAGVSFTLTRGWLAVARSLATTLGAHLIVGIDLEADSRTIATAEARALIGGLGRSSILALEPGNEPELYGSFRWGRSKSTGRPHGYGFPQFARDFSTLGTELPRASLAGPTVGAPKWFPDLRSFLASEPRVAVATLHRYPLQLCYVPRSKPNYPTIPALLSAYASRVLANTVAADAGVAHARGIPLRIDEINTISCGSDPGVAKSFAAALWALDTLFQMARVGVSGVNIHTYPRATYELFTFNQGHRRWSAFVEPEYYGLLMFAQAAPAGSQLLPVTERRGTGGLQTWATRAPDGTIRIVLINEGVHARRVSIGGPAGTYAATVERLLAPSLTARGGVKLGGRTFGARTTTGAFSGPPLTEPATAARGRYAVTVPGGSAAIVTLAPG